MLELLVSPTGMNGSRRERPLPPVLIEEGDAMDETAGTSRLACTSVVLAAWRGEETQALQLIEARIQDATASGGGTAIPLAEYARAVLYNGLGRYQAAIDAAQRACKREHPGVVDWALPELVEAGARGGSLDVAAGALRRLEERTSAGGTDWALGIQARSRALLSDRDDAEALYREALERLARSGIALHLARAQLLYGEWLRRQSRRVDAREQLRAAHGTFGRIRADGFAERARRELAATGATARKRTIETRDELTAQEAQIARLAGAGHTNPEIGAELFISPRTVEWHLHKVFIKLGISSRRELRGSLPDARSAVGNGFARPLPAAHAPARRPPHSRGLAVPWSGGVGSNRWPAVVQGGSSRATVTRPCQATPASRTRRA